ncbi:recombinase [Bacteroides fragilis]|nr:recombinase [Bacteroides fragilis]MCS2886137.1 recombinase [Bacteroides fragilis]
MVTEQPQYSVVVCIFSTSQNTEISLIPNGLRLIYTCSLLLALPCIFHAARHTWATIASNEAGVDKYTVHTALNHVDENMRVTDIYIAKSWDSIDAANRKVLDYVKLSLDDVTEKKYIPKNKRVLPKQNL